MMQTEKKTTSGQNRIDRETFAKTYEDYFPSIYKFIYYKTYHKETAEDITSQTFLKALENIDKYESKKASLSTWLYRVARNLVIDYYRTRHSTINISDVWDLAGSQDLEIDAQNKEHLEQVKGIMQELPALSRDIIIMRVWQEMPYKKIAEILGKTEQNCKMIFSRTLAKIRKTMSLACVLMILLLRV